MGFTTGAGLQIMITQVPSLFGIPNIRTNDPPYLVLFNSIASISQARLDTLFGLATVLFLVALRYYSTFMIKSGKSQFIWVKFLCYFIGLVAATFVSFVCFQGRTSIPIRVVGKVPQGLTYFKAPDLRLFPSLIVPSISIVVVGITDHIAIAKAFGRLNGYRVDSNQEIIALGIGNMFGPFFGGYSVTGSFSRSSVKRSGVKSPFSGFVTASVVLLAIYFLTPTFFYMPSASLAAVILVSISDLIARPKVVKELIELDLNDFIGFFLASVVTIFVNIEVGIFASVGYSILVLAFRIARPKVCVLSQNEGTTFCSEQRGSVDSNSLANQGVVVFQIKESLTYPNSNYLGQYLKDWIEEHTDAGPTVSDRELLWCDIPRTTLNRRNLSLKAIIFDFSSVNYMDASGVQLLMDIKSDAERWTASCVYLLFTNVHNELVEDIEYFLKKSKQKIPSSAIAAEVDHYFTKEQFIFETIEDAVIHASEWEESVP
jgi:sodium-independent sulfate anion transporter 11